MKKVILLVFFVLVLCSCSYERFTRMHSESHYESSIADSTSFLFFPIKDLKFDPMNYCLIQAPYTESTATDEWMNFIEENLRRNYPSQKWNILNRLDPIFDSLNVAYMEIQDIAYASSLTEKYESFTMGKRTSFKSEPNPKMAACLAKFNEGIDAEYAIILSQPRLLGYLGTGDQSKTTTIICNTEIEIQVWDINEGRIIYNSGSEYTAQHCVCFFYAEKSSMRENTRNLMINLSGVINGVINEEQYLR